MTEQRAPQDHARELAETWISEILYVLPLIVDEAAAARATDSLTEKFLAYRESLLAGAVPQEELRLIQQWRGVYGADTPQLLYDAGIKWALRWCADELESLIERRGKA